MPLTLNGTTGVDLPSTTTAAVKFNGSTSGTITLKGPAVAGTNTLTLPAATGTVSTTGFSVAMALVLGG